MSTPRSTVLTGIRWGLVYATVYSAYATVVVLVRGGPVLNVYHLTLPTLIGLYFGGGVLAGGIAGALLPIGRHLIGAMFVGFVAALPVMFLMAMAMLPSDEWSSTLPTVGLSSAAVLGPLCGGGFWYIKKKYSGFSA